MRNRTLLALAIAATIATPLSFAQSRGAGGPPAGASAIGNAGARISDRAAIGVDTASRAAMQRTVDRDTRTSFGAEQKTTVQAAQSQTAVDAKLKADVKADVKGDIKTDAKDSDVDTEVSDSATFGQETAVRAKLQQDADVETRKTFGATQSAAAKAKNDTADDDDSDTDTDTDGDDE